MNKSIVCMIPVLPSTTGVHWPGPGRAAADPCAAHAALRAAAAATAAGHPPGDAGARGHLHVPPQTERLFGAAQRLDGALVPAGRHPGGGAQAPAKQVQIRCPCQKLLFSFSHVVSHRRCSDMNM
jgi:hypothetical protein